MPTSEKGKKVFKTAVRTQTKNVVSATTNFVRDTEQ